jgi:hypothetical protein
MTIKDRGLKKFRTAAFQPGLISQIKQLYLEQEYVKKPKLDEQYLDYLDDKICECIEFNLDVTVTYYYRHSYELIIGKLHYYDQQKNTIRVVDKFGDWLSIKIEDIIDLQ